MSVGISRSDPPGGACGIASGFERTPASDRELQRARGEVRLEFARRGPQSFAAGIYQRSPLRVLLPSVDRSGTCEAVLSNTGGGVAGGDRLTFVVETQSGVSASITTQAAEKVYSALDTPSRLTTAITVVNAASLAWLPQETILFEGARLHRQSTINLVSGAQLVALEWLVLGRIARGEAMTYGEIRDGWRVFLDGRLIWADAFRLAGEGWAYAASPALLDRCTALATLIAFADGIEDNLDALRNLLATLPCRAGVTNVGKLLVFRFASPSPSLVRAALLAFLEQARMTTGLAGFRVPKMWSC